MGMGGTCLAYHLDLFLIHYGYASGTPWMRFGYETVFLIRFGRLWMHVLRSGSMGLRCIASNLDAQAWKCLTGAQDEILHMLWIRAHPCSTLVFKQLDTHSRGWAAWPEDQLAGRSGWTAWQVGLSASLAGRSGWAAWPDGPAGVAILQNRY